MKTNTKPSRALPVLASMAMVAVGFMGERAWAYDCGDYAYAAVYPSGTVLSTSGSNCSPKDKPRLLVSNFQSSCPNYRQMGFYKNLSQANKSKVDSISGVYVCEVAQDSDTASGGGSSGSGSGSGSGSPSPVSGIPTTIAAVPTDKETAPTGGTDKIGVNPDQDHLDVALLQAQLHTEADKQGLSPTAPGVTPTDGAAGSSFSTDLQIPKDKYGGTAPKYNLDGKTTLNTEGAAPGSSDLTGSGSGSGSSFNTDLQVPKGKYDGSVPKYSLTVDENGKPQAPTLGKTSGSEPGKVAGKGGGDDCVATTKMDGGEAYYCSSTNTWITGATVGSAVTEQLAKAGTTVAGQLAAQKSSSGTTADTYKSAASLTRTTGVTESTLGAANVGVGAYLLSLSNNHKKGGDTFSDRATALETQQEEQETALKLAERNRDRLERQQYSTNQQEAAYAKANLPGAEQKVLDADTNLKKTKAALKIATKATSEQTDVTRRAKDAAVTSMMKGAGQMIGGIAAIAAAGQMDKTANNLDNMQHSGVVAPGFNMQGDPLNPRNPTVISGAGTNPNGNTSGADSTDKKDENGNPLGGPLGGDQPGGLGTPPPAAGEFLAKDVAPAAGGSPGGIGGGAGTSPTGSGESDTAPKSAASSGGGYEGAGSGGGGGGGGRAGSGSGGGLDLAGMLGSLLPKKDDESGANKDITSYGRAPASDGSILGPNSKSLFDRVADVTHSKFKAGAIR